MSWTRSAKNKETGMFKVTVYDYEGNLFFEGEFSDVTEANKAGETNERRMMQAMQNKDYDLPEMSIDEILAELEI